MIKAAPLAGDALYRPALHFTPESQWMNDPNGLFFDGKTNHLYYQHNPEGCKFGAMNWGHATSDDLVHWTHHPIALAPDGKNWIFSGCVVVDVNLGLGSPVVAIYTIHKANAKKNKQTQGIAYSLDGGYIFTKHSDNPVIPNPGEKDFRDPKVAWHEASGKWVMVLAVGQQVWFYCSYNLMDWFYLSSFGKGVGAHGGVWECPDLIPFVASDDVQKWVLLVSINPGHPAGGSGTQYFVGNFDGIIFTPDRPDPPVLWLDAGRDNYAGITFHHKGQAGSGKAPLFIAWMSNWQYCRTVPTESWRGTMTLPRELVLQATLAGYRIKQRVPATIFTAKSWIALEQATSYDIRNHTALSLKWEGASDVELTLTSASGDYLGFEVTVEGARLDRQWLQNSEFSEAFPSVEFADFHQQGKGQHLIIVDGTSFEYFGEDGLTALSDLFFVKQWFDRLVVRAATGLDVTLQVLAP